MEKIKAKRMLSSDWKKQGTGKINTITYISKKNKYISKEQVEQIVKEIKLLLEQPKIKKIAKIEFKDRRSFNRYNINFNGVRNNDMFETFTFYTEYKNTRAQEVAEAIAEKDYNKIPRVLNLNGELKEGKCWTNKYPYARIVIKALDIIQRITKNALKIEIK